MNRGPRGAQNKVVFVVQEQLSGSQLEGFVVFCSLSKPGVHIFTDLVKLVF